MIKRSSIKYRRLGSEMYPFRKKTTLLQQVILIRRRNGNSLNFQHIFLTEIGMITLKYSRLNSRIFCNRLLIDYIHFCPEIWDLIHVSHIYQNKFLQVILHIQIQMSSYQQYKDIIQVNYVNKEVVGYLQVWVISWTYTFSNHNYSVVTTCSFFMTLCRNRL